LIATVLTQAGAEHAPGPISAVTVIYAIGAVVLLPFLWRALCAIPTPPKQPAVWGLRYSVLGGLGCILALAMSGQIVGLTLGGIYDVGDGVMWRLLQTTLALSLLSVAVLVLVRRLQHDGYGALGLGRSGNLPAIALGLACYLMLHPGLLALDRTWPWLLSQLGGELSPPSLPTAVQGLAGGKLALAALLAVVVVPLLEELLFRGFLQAALVRRLGIFGGMFSTAVVFTLLHDLEGFGVLLALSLLLGVLRWRSGRIWAGWAVHAMHNGVTLLYCLQASPELLA
jgi:membrane protease YdiL (CAAX protease family)